MLLTMGTTIMDWVGQSVMLVDWLGWSLHWSGWLIHWLGWLLVSAVWLIDWLGQWSCWLIDWVGYWSGWLLPDDKKTGVETTQGCVKIFQALQQEPEKKIFCSNPQISTGCLPSISRFSKVVITQSPDFQRSRRREKVKVWFLHWYRITDDLWAAGILGWSFI